MELHISKRLQALLPKLTDEEKKQLKENIESDGVVTETITVWNDGKHYVVVDGMHRWVIVRGTDIEYRIREVYFESYEDCELWILNHQLGRRNLLKPAAVRKIRGDLYNRLKKPRGGDQQSEKAKGQNVTLATDAASQVSKKAGVTTRTVKRDAARATKIDSLTKAAQAISEGATDKEITALAKLDEAQQDQVARMIRVDQASSVKEAMKLSGIKAPADKKKKPKPPKQLDRSAWYKQWNQSIGPLVRLVDKIANNVGESKCESQRTVQRHLNNATVKMMKWMEVEQ